MFLTSQVREAWCELIILFCDVLKEDTTMLLCSDAEKQNTMNVFLGIFRPDPSKPAIWEKEYNSNYYIHHQVSTGAIQLQCCGAVWFLPLTDAIPLSKNLLSLQRYFSQV
jgi:hypothetical protein